MRPPGAGVGDGAEGEEFRRRAVACLDGLYAFAVSLSRDRTAAEDLVQETYLRALRAARQPGEGENVRAWLFTILHNVWRNERRRSTPSSLDAMPELLVRLSARGPGPEAALDGRESRERLQRAIDALPEGQREVVLLRFGESFSYHEIASVLGCPAGTVMSRLARAREALRRALSPNGNGGAT